MENVAAILYIESRTRKCEPPENEGDGIKMNNGKRRDEEHDDDGGRCEPQQAPRGFELAGPRERCEPRPHLRRPQP